MIKVKLENQNIKTVKPYPKLMQGKSNNSIVLFTSEREGTVLFIGDRNQLLKLGQYEKCWQFDRFVDYNGPITLENV